MVAMTETEKTFQGQLRQKKTVICAECGQETPSYVRDLCRSCYDRAAYQRRQARNGTRPDFSGQLATLADLLKDGQPHTRAEVCAATGVHHKQIRSLINQAEMIGLLLYEDGNEIGLCTDNRKVRAQLHPAPIRALPAPTPEPTPEPVAAASDTQPLPVAVAEQPAPEPEPEPTTTPAEVAPEPEPAPVAEQRSLLADWAPTAYTRTVAGGLMKLEILQGIGGWQATVTLGQHQRGLGLHDSPEAAARYAEAHAIAWLTETLRELQR